MKNKDLTQGPIFPHMLKMALPMMIGMASHMLLNIVDGVYVSRLGMSESLAVLNYAFPFFYVIFAVFNGLTSGATSVLARYIGAKEKAKAENALSQIVWVGLGLFLLFMLLYPLVLPLYLSLQKAPPASGELTRQYLNTLFLGVPFTVLALLWGSGLRAEGNTRTLMMGMLVAVLANILIAPFLIFRGFRFAGVDWPGAGWGVSGAGLATTASNALTALVVYLIFFRGKTLLRLRFWPEWSNRAGLRDAFAVGMPSILSQSLIGINLVILTRLAAPFGPAAVSAIGIGSRLETLGVFPSLAIMVAVLSLVGQNFGAKRYDRVRQSVRIGLLTAFSSLTVVGLLVYAFRARLLGNFHPDPNTFSSAYHYLGISSLGFGFVGMSIVSSGAFQGLGRGMPFLFLTTLRMVFIAAPMGFLLARTQGEYGLHYAPIIASGCTAVLASAWILGAVRRLKDETGPISDSPPVSGNSSVTASIPVPT